jgi:hypothetical protein
VTLATRREPNTGTSRLAFVTSACPQTLGTAQVVGWAHLGAPTPSATRRPVQSVEERPLRRAICTLYGTTLELRMDREWRTIMGPRRLHRLVQRSSAASRSQRAYANRGSRRVRSQQTAARVAVASTQFSLRGTRGVSSPDSRLLASRASDCTVSRRLRSVSRWGGKR